MTRGMIDEADSTLKCNCCNILRKVIFRFSTVNGEKLGADEAVLRRVAQGDGTGPLPRQSAVRFGIKRPLFKIG